MLMSNNLTMKNIRIKLHIFSFVIYFILIKIPAYLVCYKL